MVRVSLASAFNSEWSNPSELNNYQDLFDPDKLHYKDPDYFNTGSEDEEITLEEYPDEENNQDNSDNNIEIIRNDDIPVIDEPDINETIPEINIPEDALIYNAENNQSEEIQIESVPENKEVIQEEIPEINPETSPGDVLKELKNESNESSENSNNQKASETDSKKEPKKDSKKNQKNDSKKKNQKTGSKKK